MPKTAASLAFMGALAGAVMFGAPAAFASTDASLSTSDAQTLCTKLSDQYQFLKPFKEGLPYWQTAKADYKEGKTDCKAGDPVKGAHAMQAAISDLYVKPDTL